MFGIRQFLVEWLAKKLPHFEITRADGQAYMHRYVIWRAKDDGPSFFLHHFVGDDPDGLHNHPNTWAVSLILVGKYFEERMNGALHRSKWFKPGSLNFIGGDDFHRVNLHGGEAWTLFLRGRRNKTWGFLMPDGSFKEITNRVSGRK